jgi:hypothetical protein
MSDNIARIQGELESLGYQTTLLGSPFGRVVAFPYIVEVGSQKGKQFSLGISMEGKESYPEHPPHWIHIKPPINDGKGVVQSYSGNCGEIWIAMSRPPGSLWDQLPTKHMSAYLTEHIRRFWNDI